MHNILSLHYGHLNLKSVWKYILCFSFKVITFFLSTAVQLLNTGFHLFFRLVWAMFLLLQWISLLLIKWQYYFPHVELLESILMSYNNYKTDRHSIHYFVLLRNSVWKRMPICLHLIRENGKRLIKPKKLVEKSNTVCTYSRRLSWRLFKKISHRIPYVFWIIYLQFVYSVATFKGQNYQYNLRPFYKKYF